MAFDIFSLSASAIIKQQFSVERQEINNLKAANLYAQALNISEKLPTNIVDKLLPESSGIKNYYRRSPMKMQKETTFVERRI